MSMEARRGPRTGVIDSCETPSRCWGSGLSGTSIEPLSLQAFKKKKFFFKGKKECEIRG